MNVIILRGVSGSSKSTFANLLKTLHPDATIVSADDYFNYNGKYIFVAEGLGRAHLACQNKFLEALERKDGVIIVDNTNTRSSEFSFYKENAEKNGYRVFSVVVEKRFEGGDNGHAVPEPALERQRANIINSLKLR